MDGFTGFKSAVDEEIPEAVADVDSFQVVRLDEDVVEKCRRRVQQ